MSAMVSVMSAVTAMAVRMILAESIRFQMCAQLVAKHAEFGNLLFGEACSELRVFLMEARLNALDSLFPALTEKNLCGPAVSLVVYTGNQSAFLHTAQQF